jgi:glycosyltransferase involved in cell wall biosynthesis
VTARVAVDLRRAAWAPYVGISRYARSLLSAMIALEPTDVELCALDLHGSRRSTHAATIRVGAGSYFVQRLVQEQLVMPRLSRKFDLLHLPWYEGPFFPACPLVINVHDLDTIERPDGYSIRFRAYYNTLLRLYIRRAQWIIVPSAATGEALERRWPGRSYVVILYGVDPVFAQRSDDGRESDPPYILYTGGFGRRKRVEDLLAAFERIAEAERDLKLLITGRASAEVLKAVKAMTARERVEFTGYVGDERLASLYRSASALVYPSALEGFGFPVVEAFASGTPVIACRSSSIPEIAEGAALLVTPASPGELADALLAVLRDHTLAGDLREAGLKRAQRFRWSETARRTLEVYREALG